jgi:macrolide transport system ATP-binding/permease protein
MSDRRPIIEVRNLTKVYRAEARVPGEAVPEVRALDGLTLSIERGDFVAIMGQSGSGKSTFMQILGLLDRKSSGDYLLDGQDVSNYNDTTLAQLRSEKIGFIFQFFNLLPRTTATNQVALPILYSGGPDPEKRAHELLNLVGMGTRLNHLPNQLSGGQQQRVAIARALANHPQLIFADEPTGNISTEQSNEILAMLEELNRSGTTIIVVTHEPEVAERANRVIHLRDGRVFSDERLRPNVAAIPAEAPPAERSETIFDWRRIQENLRMAFVALSLNKLRTALATLGIVIGISSVVAMVAIGKGAQKTIEDQLASLGTNLLNIMPMNQRSMGNMVSNLKFRQFKVEDYEALRKLVEPGGAITDVGATLGGSVTVSNGDRNATTRLLGATASYESMQNATLTAGHFFTNVDDVGRARVALLGQTVLKNLYGETVNPLGMSIKINRVEFRVVGVLTAKGANGFQDADDQVIIPLRTAMFRVLGKTTLGNLSASVREENLIDEATDEISDLLRQRRNIRDGKDDDFDVRSLNEIRDAVNKSTAAISSLLAAIASISLLVGGIGIMNVMLVSVKERTKEIGLRKALGARKRDVMAQFLVESILICSLGGCIGLALGFGISLGVSRALGWGMFFPPSAAAAAFFFSAFVGLVFGLWPAKQASDLSPIEALRYE